MKTLKHILKLLLSKKELSHINFSQVQNFQPQSKENSNNIEVKKRLRGPST